MIPNTILHFLILDLVNSRIPFFVLIFSLMFCEEVFPQMLMSMTSSFCIQYFPAEEKILNSNVDGMLEDYIILDILSTFPLKSSFSLSKERQEKTSNSVNDVTVIIKLL